MIFGGMSRDNLREMYRAAWRKYKSQLPLSPLEKQIVAVISEHPEYRVIVESAASDLANYSPRSGQLNPWLHMGLHLAIREQVSTNRPAGIAEVHAKLAIGSGGSYALAAARALIKHTDLSAREIAVEALRIAGEICIYSNQNVVVEEL